MPVFASVDGKAGIAATLCPLLAGRRPDPRKLPTRSCCRRRTRDRSSVCRRPCSPRHLQPGAGRTMPVRRRVAADLPEALPHATLLGKGRRKQFRSAADVNNRGSDITVSILGGGFFERYRSEIAGSPVLSIRLRPGASPESFVAAARRLLPKGVDADFDLVNASATFDAVNVLTTGLWLSRKEPNGRSNRVGQGVVRQVRSDDDERAFLANLGATRRVQFAVALGPVSLAALIGISAALLGSFFASELMPIGFARRIEPNAGRVLDATVLARGRTCLCCVGDRRRCRPCAGHDTRNGHVRLVPSLQCSRWRRRQPRSVFATRPHPAGARAVPIRSAFVGSMAAVAAGIIGVLGFSAGLANLIHTPSLYGWNFDAIDISNQVSARWPRIRVSPPSPTSAPACRSGSTVARRRVRPSHRSEGGEILPAVVSGRAPAAIDEVAFRADTLQRGPR